MLQPLAVDAKIKNGAYWKQKKSKKKQTKKRFKKRDKRKGSESESDTDGSSSDEVAWVDEKAENTTMSARVETMESKMTTMESRITANVEDKLKEQKREIAEDLINPLTKKMDQVETIMVDLATKVGKTLSQPAPLQNPPLGYNRQPLAISYARGAAPPTRGYMGGAKGGRNGHPKRPLVCWNCKKEGHPARLCTEMQVVNCVEIIRGAENFEFGGTDVCTVEDIMESFSLDDQQMDPETVCYIAADWAREKIHQIYGETLSKSVVNRNMKSDESGCAQSPQRLKDTKQEHEMIPEVTHTEDGQKLSGGTTGGQDIDEPRSELRGATSSGAEGSMSQTLNENVISNDASKEEAVRGKKLNSETGKTQTSRGASREARLAVEQEGSCRRCQMTPFQTVHLNESKQRNKLKGNEISHADNDSDNDSNSEGVRKVKTTEVWKGTTSDRETESHNESDDGSDNKSGDEEGSPGVTNETNVAMRDETIEINDINDQESRSDGSTEASTRQERGDRTRLRGRQIARKGGRK